MSWSYPPPSIYSLGCPGHAALKMVPSTVKKAHRVVDFLLSECRKDITIEVYGNITPENGCKLIQIGAEIFVCGSGA